MACSEYRIRVTLTFPDGRRERLEVSRRGSDHEAVRKAVWHEYKERFDPAGELCLTTDVAGVSGLELPATAAPPPATYGLPSAALNGSSRRHPAEQ